MAENLPTTLGKGVHIKYKGMVDFRGLWKLVFDWFESKGYEVQEGKSKHAAKTFGDEFESDIDAWRNVTDHYRFNLKVHVKYWDGVPVEVVRGGEKKVLIKARFYFRITGSLVLDWADRFERTKFSQALGKFLNYRVLMWQWDSIYGDQLNYKILEIQNLIKEYLGAEASGSEYADMW
jgi:hypothetical protein